MLNTIFIVITFLSFILFYIGTGKDKRVLIFFSAWMIIIGFASFAGFFQNIMAFPPRLIFVLMPSLIYVIYFYRKLNSVHFKLNFLLAIHTLRLPVEVVLYRLFINGKIPVIMTFHGYNFDIIIGIAAIVLGIYVIITKREINKHFFKVWNIFGLIFLGIIVIIAVLSVPSPFQQLAFDQPNVAILRFPFTFLPSVVVPIVLLSHLLTLKALRIKN